MIEPIEIKLRTIISHYVAGKYGAEGHLESSNFRDVVHHNEFVKQLKHRIDKGKKEKGKKDKEENADLIIRHHEAKYGGKMPFWVAIEFVTFGQLSKFYANMIENDQKSIAYEFAANATPEKLGSWLRSLVVTRNICAHYGRLYNMPIAMQPDLNPEHKKYTQERYVKVSVILLTLKYLNVDTDDWNNFVTSLSALIETFEHVRLSFIGFPPDWEAVLSQKLPYPNRPKTLIAAEAVNSPPSIFQSRQASCTRS